MVEAPSDEETEKIRTQFMDSPELPAWLQKSFRSWSTTKLKEVLVKIFTDSIRDAAKIFLDKKGVTCFSETPDNLLMWSHYGDKFRGFCLEFDTAFVPFNGLIEVNYSDKIPVVPLSSGPLFENGRDGLIRMLYCTKSKDWAYEREWRAIHQEKEKLFHYQAASLTGVYFGPESMGVSQEIICLILQGQNENVSFYRGRRSETEFKVVFERFTYTPHLVVKKAGLIS